MLCPLSLAPWLYLVLVQVRFSMRNLLVEQLTRKHSRSGPRTLSDQGPVSYSVKVAVVAPSSRSTSAGREKPSFSVFTAQPAWPRSTQLPSRVPGAQGTNLLFFSMLPFHWYLGSKLMLAAQQLAALRHGHTGAQDGIAALSFSSAP